MNDFALQVIEQALSSPKSKKELLELFDISERTLRNKLSILKRRKIVSEKAVFTDLRKKVFYLTKGGLS